jgi:sulfate adenylyltransferase subunit 2
VKHLRQLEDQSVYILREAYKHFDHLAMLWSMGKDSTVLLWLARKAFFGHVPFPLLHVDTSYKIPAMIEYRDRIAREWRLNLVVGQNKEALAAGMNPSMGRVTCCTALKTQGLKNLIEDKGYTGVILGVRADEEGTRAKERYFSPRDKHGDWDFRDQPPELWTSLKRPFHRALIYAFTRCWTGPRSTFGSTSNSNIFHLLISIWIRVRALGTEASAVRRVPFPSSPQQKP